LLERENGEEREREMGGERDYRPGNDVKDVAGAASR